MTTRDASVSLRQFLGLNRRDGADLVHDNEFLTLQNFYQETKGLLYKTPGSTYHVAPGDIPYASEITGIYKIRDQLLQKATLLYCKPDATVLDDPTVAPTLVESGTDGEIFDGGAITGNVDVCYSWVGLNHESSVSPVSTILISNTNKAVVATLPVFPNWVKSANVFYRRDATHTYTFAGVVRSSGGSLRIKAWAGPVLAVDDDIGQWAINIGPGGMNTSNIGTGSLRAGVYYVTACWAVINMEYPKVCSNPPTTTALHGNETLQVIVPTDGSSICVQQFQAGLASSNGAKWLHFFIGLNPPGEGPMFYAGTRKSRATNGVYADPETLEITDFPIQSNAASYPITSHVTSNKTVRFFQVVPITTSTRRPFITRIDNSFGYFEIMFPRDRDNGSLTNPFTGGAYPETVTQVAYNNRARFLRASNQRPCFASFIGRTLIANGTNLLLVTDGFGIGEVVEDYGTVQPPGFPQLVTVVKSQVVVTVTRYESQQNDVINSPAKDQVFGSNALTFSNWSDGGSGTDLRFVTIGDGFSNGVTAIGTYSFNSATDGPRSFILALKKGDSHILTNIPDLSASVTASVESLSGRTGCIAPYTLAATPLGPVFLGSDGDVYGVRSSGGEPARIGNKIRPFLLHLTENDALMKLCTASYHKGFYKLSYPSSSTSTTNDAQLWCDMRTGDGSPFAWSGPHLGISVGAQIVPSLEDSADDRFATVEGTASVAKMDDISTFQHLGTNISSVAEWKTSRFKNESHFKRFMAMVMDLYYDSQFTHAVMLEGFADAQYTQQNRTLSSGAAIWNASNYDSSSWGDAMFFPIPIEFGPDNLVGRTFRWKLTHENNAQIILAAATILMQPERRRISL